MAGAVPDHLIDAVGACTRALAGAGVFEPALAASDAATLGALRAHGDRLALRHRFHDAAAHHAHAPRDAREARLFDALEQARLDALGVRWLAGVARNLLSYPGKEDDGPRWAAFEVFSGRPAPPEKTRLAAEVRRRLPAALLADLEDLAALLDQQPQFAPRAAVWAAAAIRHLPDAAPVEHAGRAFPLPVRRVEIRERRKRGASTATSAPLARHEGARESGDASSSADGVAREMRGGTATYRVYTDAYDRVVNAASVTSREELLTLRAALEAELNALRPVVARLAKRLLRVLMSRQVRQWQFDLDEGLIDSARLAALVASPGAGRPFKQELDSPFPGTVVTLLIDHSGSMRGRPMRIAALTVELFARVLERCGVKCEVLGFTTRDWNGGEPARRWAEDGYPENPGRLNALEHIVIKSADVPWRRARVALGLFLHDDMLKENIDGEAVMWAHARLLARSETRRILVVVSDGTPMDEATLAANGFDYLDQHLASVVDDIERRSPVQLAAIGIGHDVSHVYRNATTIARVDELGPALGAKLMALLGTG